MHFSNPEQLETDEDIARILASIRSNQAWDLQIYDDGTNTRFQRFRPLPNDMVLLYDVAARQDRAIDISFIEDLLRNGEAFQIGGAGEQRYGAAAAEDIPANVNLGANAAVISIATRICRERGLVLDTDLQRLLGNMNSNDLTQAVMRLAREPAYLLQDELTAVLPVLN